MTTAQQQMNDFATEQLETVLRFARISIDAAERMVKLQVETAKNTFEDSARSAASRSGDVGDVSSSHLPQESLELFTIADGVKGIILLQAMHGFRIKRSKCIRSRYQFDGTCRVLFCKLVSVGFG